MEGAEAAADCATAIDGKPSAPDSAIAETQAADSAVRAEEKFFFIGNRWNEPIDGSDMAVNAGGAIEPMDGDFTTNGLRVWPLPPVVSVAGTQAWNVCSTCPLFESLR